MVRILAVRAPLLTVARLCAAVSDLLRRAHAELSLRDDRFLCSKTKAQVLLPLGVSYPKRQEEEFPQHC